MVAHHYALPLKAQDTQSAGISQQMHSLTLGTGAGKSLAVHIKHQQEQRG